MNILQGPDCYKTRYIYRVYIVCLNLSCTRLSHALCGPVTSLKSHAKTFSRGSNPTESLLELISGNKTQNFPE